MPWIKLTMALGTKILIPLTDLTSFEESSARENVNSKWSQGEEYEYYRETLEEISALINGAPPENTGSMDIDDMLDFCGLDAKDWPDSALSEKLELWPQGKDVAGGKFGVLDFNREAFPPYVLVRLKK